MKPYLDYVKASIVELYRGYGCTCRDFQVMTAHAQERDEEKREGYRLQLIKVVGKRDRHNYS